MDDLILSVFIRVGEGCPGPGRLWCRLSTCLTVAAKELGDGLCAHIFLAVHVSVVGLQPLIVLVCIRQVQVCEWFVPPVGLCMSP